MKDTIVKYKNELALFLLVTTIYLIFAIIFHSKTSIFYDTYGGYDVILDTDSGPLFDLNIFAVGPDNSKHILFTQIVSICAYPIYLISNLLSHTDLEFKSTYAAGLTILQVLVSSTSITLIYNIISKLKLNKTTLFLIMTIMIFSFPQMLMSLNIERFIYAQLSLIFFVFLISNVKNRDSYLIDIAAIPLFGITLTNGYLYIINLLLQYKYNLKKIAKHIGVFFIGFYIILTSTKAYQSLFVLGDMVKGDTIYIPDINLIDRIKMIIARLIYPIVYFPSHEIEYNKIWQRGPVNNIYLILITILFILAIVGGIRNYQKRIPQLCICIVIVNIFLHGLIGYNLANANIMAIHFAFAIFILISYLAQDLSMKNLKLLNFFLIIILITGCISNINGFIEIFKLGVSAYPI